MARQRSGVPVTPEELTSSSSKQRRRRPAHHLCCEGHGDEPMEGRVFSGGITRHYARYKIFTETDSLDEKIRRNSPARKWRQLSRDPPSAVARMQVTWPVGREHSLSGGEASLAGRGEMTWCGEWRELSFSLAVPCYFLSCALPGPVLSRELEERASDFPRDARPL